MGNGQRLHREGSVTIVQSDTDPGDLGEPRELAIDGRTLLIVPSFELWAKPDRDGLAARVMAALNEHGHSYQLPRDPSDLAYAVADALLR